MSARRPPGNNGTWSEDYDCLLLCEKCHTILAFGSGDFSGTLIACPACHRDIPAYTEEEARNVG